MGLIEKPSPTADTLGRLWNLNCYGFSMFVLQRILKSRENMMAQNNIKSLPVLVTPFSMQCIQNSLIFAMRSSGSLVTGTK